MGLYWRQMFNSAGESTTLAQLNPGVTATAANYRPPTNAQLLKVAIEIGSEAATSLVEDVRVELTCTLWKPNKMELSAKGAGLRTAPAVQLQPYVFDVDQPVATDTDIEGYYVHDSGVPVTSRIRVFGLFRA